MNLDSDRISLFGIYVVSVAYLICICAMYHSMHRTLHAHSKKNNSLKVLKEEHSLKIQLHEKLKELLISMTKFTLCVPDHSKDKSIQLYFILMFFYFLSYPLQPVLIWLWIFLLNFLAVSFLLLLTLTFCMPKQTVNHELVRFNLYVGEVITT